MFLSLDLLVLGVAIILLVIRGILRDWRHDRLLAKHYDQRLDQRVLPTMLKMEEASRPVIVVPWRPPRKRSGAEPATSGDPPADETYIER
jgi:hypothetical protein